MSDQSFPLDWPAGWVRTLPQRRLRAPFHKIKRVSNGTSTWQTKESLDISDGLQRLEGELRRLGAQHIVISSNLYTTRDGRPHTKQAKMLSDPGVAVYFKVKGRPMALACDKWQSAAENMAAMAGHIEAIRASDRYGVGSIEQAFAGYRALPADSAADWRQVFGFEKGSTPALSEVKSKLRERAHEAHPDKGGTEEGMMHLNRAFAYAQTELTS